ncbi:MAG TPA: hypothetical protein VF177_19380 [Anaerolineae bacterium]
MIIYRFAKVCFLLFLMTLLAACGTAESASSSSHDAADVAAASASGETEPVTLSVSGAFALFPMILTRRAG